MQRKHLIITIAAGLGLAGAIAFAANRGAIAPIFAAAGTTASQAGSVAAGSFAVPQGSFVRMAKPVPPPAPPTVDDVGDLDSFGRNVRWLGQKSGVYGVDIDCAAWTAEDPAAHCQQVANPATTTSYHFDDILRFKLPANASNSMFCYLLTPMFQAYFTDNTGTNAVVGSLTYSVTATVENPVLNTAGLVNPVTGAPFNGTFTTGSLAFEVFQTALVPQFPLTTTQRKSVACNAGISKRLLMETYGLTQAQANSFFANPTTLRLNVGGSARFVDRAVFSVGIRLLGD